MTKQNLRYYVLVAILGFLAVFTIIFMYSSEETSQTLHTRDLSLDIIGWHGIEIPIEDYVIQILETEDILYRRYRKEKDGEVYLSIVFSEDNRKIVHPPEVCYTAGGWEVTRDVSIEETFHGRQLPMKELIIEQKGYQQVVWYFFKSGDKITDHYLSQQFNIVLNKLLGRPGNAALIRLSSNFSPSVPKDDARRALSQFLKDALPSILESLP